MKNAKEINKNNEIKVWNLSIRLFHWFLVAAFVFSYLTAEENTTLHSYSGYFIVFLLAFRICWGFIGNRYAQFESFMVSPSALMRYLKSVYLNKSKRYVGHNPAGGWMIIAMLITLSFTTLSGMALYALEEGKGPFSNAVEVQEIDQTVTDNVAFEQGNELHALQHEEHNKEQEEIWEEIHEVSVNLMLLLILLHIVGVIVTGRKHKENLVKAMISGKKRAK